MHDNAVVCVKCGCAIHKPGVFSDKTFDPSKSEKDWLVCLLLCFFVGYLGIHRFYVGKTGSGIAQLLTCGGCGVWVLIDLIMIVLGRFTDEEGKVIK